MLVSFSLPFMFESDYNEIKKTLRSEPSTPNKREPFTFIAQRGVFTAAETVLHIFILLSG